MSEQPQPQPSAERRRSPRQSARLIVHFEPRGRAAAPPSAARTEDLGPDGMFIATRRPLARGTRLFVEAFLDDSPEPPVGLECVVRWRRRFREPHGMGVSIVAGSASDLERLGRWLAAVTPPAALPLRRPA
jgi:hypothetical protein